MAKTIEPKLMTIGEYFKGDSKARFVIPEYQRAYSWQTWNCDKLWQDITANIEAQSADRYFLGTVILSCENDDTVFSIIDGQQRTTTFLLLLKALLLAVNVAINKIDKNDPDSEVLLRALRIRRRKLMMMLYKADEDEITEYPSPYDVELYGKHTILTSDSINEIEDYKKDFDVILTNDSFEEIERKVHTIKHKKYDNKYTNFFKNFKFFYNKCIGLSESRINSFAKGFIEQCEIIQIKSWNAEQAITMFNSLNSDGLPLFDSDIISSKLYAAASSSPEKRQTVTDLWRDIKEKIEEGEKAGAPDLNDILMEYMYYLRTINRETLTESGSINLTTPGLRRYFNDNQGAHFKDPVKFCNDLLRLVKAWEKIIKLPSFKVISKLNANYRLFLASYLLRLDESECTAENLNPIIESLTKVFTMLEIDTIPFSSNRYKAFLFQEEIRMADPNVSIQEIELDFKAQIEKEFANRADFEGRLADYEGHALVYLNEYLFAKEHNVRLVFGSNDVEHIMPNSGRNIEAIRRDAGISDENEFAAIVNQLGNKIVLESAINRSIGNEWFRSKVSSKVSDKTGYIDSAYPIAKALVENYKDAGHPYWTKEDIEKATGKAIKRILDFVYSVE